MPFLFQSFARLFQSLVRPLSNPSILTLSLFLILLTQSSSIVLLGRQLLDDADGAGLPLRPEREPPQEGVVVEGLARDRPRQLDHADDRHAHAGEVRPLVDLALPVGGLEDLGHGGLLLGAVGVEVGLEAGREDLGLLGQVHDHDLADELGHRTAGGVRADDESLLDVVRGRAGDLDQDVLAGPGGGQGRLLLPDAVDLVLLSGGHHDDLGARADGAALDLAHGDGAPVRVPVQYGDAHGGVGIPPLHLE
mmetsp:Transcript_1361/g.2957  ORF Transcript_1361/g.2957 Transcript_1361/m.2957 type:complete len:250 (+) Transcript_1361:109-858(+)